ncbi:MAG: tRNA 2-thiouridine(34) synthase MnmA, partial [Alphaproteobacteria bacterium]|nr:tRNA 2-thiouridine(34) synthase MnmA [Alphaproteobacteria bacterium]
MSGGVDSSVTAALLKQAGHDVVGVTLRLHSCGAGPEAAIRDARRVAERLGVEHRVLDCTSSFAACVMDYFADSYLRGETPVPCVPCNKRIKFGELLSFARELGATALATGHYVRCLDGAAGPELHVAADTSRDQSYFLYTLTRAQLGFLLFPLGDIESKTATRALAESFGLPVAAKSDSQDICFVPDGDYVGLVRRLRPDAIKPGAIVDEKGAELGRHEGILHFTVGQRRGLNIGNRTGDNNEPLFVLRLEAATNRVVVGPRAVLARREVFLREVNWLGEEVPSEGVEVTARLRSAQHPAPAR